MDGSDSPLNEARIEQGYIDKNHQPSPQESKEALGPSFPLWERLLQFIEDTYQMPGEFSFGGKNYGWNIWYRKSGKSLVSLYPQDKSIVAQVVLGKDQVEKALANCCLLRCAGSSAHPACPGSQW